MPQRTIYLFWLFGILLMKLQGVNSHICHDHNTLPEEWRFHQLPDCPDDYWHSSQSSYEVRSLLECAKRCAKDTNCLSFYIKRFSQILSCGPILTRVTSCQQLDYSYGAKLFLKSDSTCLNPWRRAFVQSNGNVLFGSLSDLIEMVERGSRIRIMIGIQRAAIVGHETSLYDVDSVWVSNTTVTAQMFKWTWDDNTTEALWTQVQADTSGLLTETYYGEPFLKSQTDIDLVWYVQDTTVKCGIESPVVLERDSDGTTIQGSYQDLKTAVEEGFPIQVVERRDGNHYSRSFSASQISVGNDSFEITGVWLGPSPDSAQNEQFTTEIVTIVTGQNFTVTFSEVDTMDNAFNGATQDNNVSLLLAADFCWDRIATTNEYGEVESGSIQTFLDHVKSGSDIRVVYRCVNTLSTKSLNIDRVAVTSTGFAAYSMQSPITLAQHIEWNWTELSSDGTITDVTHDSFDGYQLKTTCQAQMSWLVNTRKRRKLWFHHDGNGVNSDESWDFPKENIIEGLMPRITTQTSEDKTIWFSFKSHKVSIYQINNSDFNVHALNYGNFIGSYWDIFFPDSRHFSWHAGISIDSSPVPENSSSLRPFWTDWFF